MIINVTDDDITKGNASLDACPITIALRRELGNDKISIGRNFIRIPKKRPKGQWKLVQLPSTAREFLLNHYSYIPNQPITFFLSKKEVGALKG